MNTIVSVEWLQDHLHQEDLVILDASKKSSSFGITGARHFDIARVFSDQSSNLPNTFPSKEQFVSEARKLGINKSSKIVAYDGKGIYLSPRVWWLFRMMGHEDIAVLDGGLPEWIRSGGSLFPNDIKIASQGNFEAKPPLSHIFFFDQLVNNLESKNYQVVDARSNDRFCSRVPEPREGLRRGNIPNSINMPYTEVLDDGKLKSTEELKNILGRMDGSKPIFSCGSGITACIVMLAAEHAGIKTEGIYDGSWTEWAQKYE